MEEGNCVNPTKLKTTKIRLNNSNKKTSTGMPFHTADCGLGSAALTARTSTDPLFRPTVKTRESKAVRKDTSFGHGDAPEGLATRGSDARWKVSVSPPMLCK